ncbi:pentapeptide repeat-containing protein [Planktomarina temperata]|nr:pentapeptide repeat-containing protein [Planktomarina temperata]
MTAAEDKNPWLRLARFSKFHKENIQLWNGYQKYLLGSFLFDYDSQMENPKFANIVDLSDAEIQSIQTKIPDLPKELERDGAIVLSEGLTEIKTPLELDGFYFAFRVVSGNTTFKRSLFLNNAQFAADLEVDNCVFREDLYATAANFGPFTTFRECRFIGYASFNFATFDRSRFSKAIFNDTADFYASIFNASSTFNEAIFKGKADFSNVTVDGQIIFDKATFCDGASFDDARPDRSAAPLSFNATKFCKHPPHFFGRALHEDTDWTGVKLPNAGRKTAQCECLQENDKRADDTVQMADKPRDSEAQAALSRKLLEHDKRAYEQLRIKCGALGKVEDEHLFFRREMELTGHLSPWYTRATYWLYHLVSDYGHSYWRPIAGMVGVWYFWSLFYALHFMARDQLHLCMDRLELLRSTMGLSFANIFAVFGFYRRFPSDLLADPTVVTVLLTVSETLLGFVFLFFLGLGLRTRFRLR